MIVHRSRMRSLKAGRNVCVGLVQVWCRFRQVWRRVLRRASHAFAIGRTQVWCRFGAGLVLVGLRIGWA